MAKIIPDRFAIMAVDPGTTTGCGTGIFRTDRGDDMLVSVMGRAVRKNQISTWQEQGDPEEQAWAVALHWSSFRFKCNTEYGIAIPDIHLVVESFELRTQLANLSPVLMMGGLNALLRRGIEPGSQPWPLGRPERQEPSTAKRVTNRRLKDMNVWVVGSEHRRDVLRHIVAKVSAIL